MVQDIRVGRSDWSYAFLVRIYVIAVNQKNGKNIRNGDAMPPKRACWAIVTFVSDRGRKYGMFQSFVPLCFFLGALVCCFPKACTWIIAMWVAYLAFRKC